jgi:hypothetical protein
MAKLNHSESIFVAVSPEVLYALVSDITRVGEWSPECRESWWDDDSGPKVGDWFTGRNQSGESTWQTRSKIVAANQGEEFAWQVNETIARWRYTFERVAGGTKVTESWSLLSDGVAFFTKNFGDKAEEAMSERSAIALSNIQGTLPRLKEIAESSTV